MILVTKYCSKYIKVFTTLVYFDIIIIVINDVQIAHTIFFLGVFILNPLLCMLGASNITIDIVLILSIIVLLLLSAFFSSCETAFSTLNMLRLKSYVDNGVKSAKRTVYIVENFDKALVTILVGNNLVNIASTTICAYLFANWILNPTVANVTNTVVMTIIVLTFGEILPKCLAKQNPEKLAMRFSGIMRFFMRVLFPVSWVFYNVQKILTRRVKADDSPTVTEDELENIIDTMEEEGVIEKDDADMMQGVLDIQDKTSYDIMTPRVDMVGAKCDNSKQNIEHIKDIFLQSQYSRIPLYETDKDHVIGILNQKDFFGALLKGENIDLTKMMSQPVYVSEQLKVDDLIRRMQQEKQHMAIVVDEHGGTSGLVSLEDAIEEMVGEIYDEHDDSTDQKIMISQIDENHYEVDGEMGLKDLFDYLGIEHVPNTDYNSVAGFLYELSENLPQLNKELSIQTIDDVMQPDGTFVEKRVDLTFKLIDLKGKRIKKALLTVNREPNNEEN